MSAILYSTRSGTSLEKDRLTWLASGVALVKKLR